MSLNDNGCWRAAGILALIWLTAEVFPFRPFTLDFDSANYALGVLDYDVAQHRPHAPGYPLWIAAAKLLNRFTGDARTALMILALFFSAAALPGFFLLARRLFGKWGALFAVTCLAFSPPVMLYGFAPATYAVDLFASCWIGWFSWSVLEKNVRRLPAGLALLAVLAGFRQSGAAFLAPLMLVAAIATLRARRRLPLVCGGAIAAVLGAAWVIPTAKLIGSFETWRRLNQQQWLRGVTLTSIFYGAPWKAHALMLRSLVLHLGVTFAIPVGCFIVLQTMGAREAEARGLKPARFRMLKWFCAVWASPCLLVDVFFHYPKPGYLLLILPPLFLLLTSAVMRRLRSDPSSLLKAAGAVAVSSLVFGFVPWKHTFSANAPMAVDAIDEARPAYARLVVETHDRLAQILSSEQPGTFAVVAAISSYPINIRTLQADFPALAIAAPFGSHLQVYKFGVPQPLDALPLNIRSIYWIEDAAEPDKGIRNALPATKTVFRNPLCSVWRSQLPNDAVDLTARLNGADVVIRRAGIPLPDVLFERGFSELEISPAGNCVWSLGPRATVRVQRTGAGANRMKLHFRVGASYPGVTGRLSIDDRLYRVFNRFAAGEDIEIDLPETSSTSEATFEYDRWDGHPKIIIKGNERPLAVMFCGIDVEQASGRFPLLGR